MPTNVKYSFSTHQFRGFYLKVTENGLRVPTTSCMLKEMNYINRENVHKTPNTLFFHVTWSSSQKGCGGLGSFSEYFRTSVSDEALEQ